MVREKKLFKGKSLRTHAPTTDNSPWHKLDWLSASGAKNQWLLLIQGGVPKLSYCRQLLKTLGAISPLATMFSTLFKNCFFPSRLLQICCMWERVKPTISYKHIMWLVIANYFKIVMMVISPEIISFYCTMSFRTVSGDEQFTSFFFVDSAVTVIHCRMILIGSLKSSLSIGWLTKGTHAFQ